MSSKKKTETESSDTSLSLVEPPAESLAVKESKRDVREIIEQYVEIGENGSSLKLKAEGGEIPIEEFLPTVRFYQGVAERSQFLIGDLMIAGDKIFKTQLLLSLTTGGFNYNTLSAYASIAKAFPPSKRKAALPWSHYQAAAVLENDEKTKGKGIELLKDAETADEGKPLPLRAFKQKVAAETTPKKKPKKKDAPKPGRKPKKNAPPKDYVHREPLAEEMAALDDLYTHKIPKLIDIFQEIEKIMDTVHVKESKLTLWEVIKKADKAQKKALVNAMPDLAALRRFMMGIQNVEDVTGY